MMIDCRRDVFARSLRIDLSRGLIERHIALGEDMGTSYAD